VGSGTKIGHAFGIKDQKFAYKNGFSDEKTYLVTTLSLGTDSQNGNELHFDTLKTFGQRFRVCCFVLQKSFKTFGLFFLQNSLYIFLLVL